MAKATPKTERSNWLGDRASFWLPRTIITVGILYVLGQAAFELYRSIPYLEIFSAYSINWKIVFLGLFAVGALVFLATMVAVWFPHKFAKTQERLVAWRERLGWLRWLVACYLLQPLPLT